MKKQFLALSLITTTSILTQVKADECCCYPQPKACIDSVCYTPAYYDLQCDCGFFVTGDFLYWYARETNLTYGLKTISKPQTIPNLPLFPEEDISDVLFAKDFLYFNVDWEPGFRVGIGWNSACDGWDLYAHYTYYRNSTSRKTTVPPFATLVPNEDGELGLLSPWGNQAMFQTPYFHDIKAKWKLQFNSIDLELGRKYWLSPCFALRPYAALRGAWTKARFSTDATTDAEEDFLIPRTDFFGKETASFKSTYWGVGFLTGLQPNWYFTSCFSLFSNFDAALIWGKFDSTKDATFFQTDISGEAFGIRQNQSNRAKANYYKMQAIIDVAIGLRWEEKWCCDRFRSTVDVGWEHHIWFEHNERYLLGDQIASGGPPGNPAVLYTRTYDTVVSNLVFGGLVVRARFDF